ncbi:MAG: patatin family protein [Oscillospiraceae bacterium]|nr:patatin family protein [Oscillospiraceae bacterium]
MTGLVLEGGTFRGIFSAGIMDAFIEEGIEFPYIVGVSAGISNGASYVSKQFGRNIEILEKYRNDKRYLSVGNYRKCRSMFGLDFVFGDIPRELVPFDYGEFRRYTGTCLVGVTNAETGKAEFKNALEDSENFDFLRATCAIPGYFPAIMIDGKPYFDGGLASPICVKQALKDGCSRVVIILTQPEGFVKKCGKGNVAMSQLIRHKYPNVEMLLLTRHKLYNKQIEFCNELERRGKALIFRPSHKLNSFEKDEKTLRAVWQEGYEMGKSRAEEIRAFMSVSN